MTTQSRTNAAALKRSDCGKIEHKDQLDLVDRLNSLPIPDQLKALCAAYLFVTNRGDFSKRGIKWVLSDPLCSQLIKLPAETLKKMALERMILFRMWPRS